jgi:hypothetical protein
MDSLKRLLQQKGLQLLELSTADCLPGRLLKLHYYWRFGDFAPEIRLDGEMGWASGVLGIPMLGLSPRQPTNWVVDNVTDQFSISAGAGLPQFGLTATGSIESGVAVTWTISEMETVVLGGTEQSQLYTSLLPRLKQLACPGSQAWLSDCFLVTQSIFAKALSGKIHTSGSDSGKAAFERAGVTANASASLNFTTDHDFAVVGSPTVPFAVRGEGIA